MQATYSRDADAAYIYLGPVIEAGQSARQVILDDDELKRDLILDLDEDGRLLGIEVLGARGFLRDEFLDEALPPGEARGE